MQSSKMSRDSQTNIDLKIQLIKADNFFVFYCFCNHSKCYITRTNSPISMGFSPILKMLKLKLYPDRKCQKNTKLFFFDFMTHFAWSHHILWIALPSSLPTSLRMQTEQLVHKDTRLSIFQKVHQGYLSILSEHSYARSSTSPEDLTANWTKPTSNSVHQKNTVPNSHLSHEHRKIGTVYQNIPSS